MTFRIAAADFEPAYLALHRAGELHARARVAVDSLRSCTTCPRDCRVDRFHGEVAVCKTGRNARVASFFAHFGEEDCLRGNRGSGTIFFARCNLRCVFCQNFDISQMDAGREADARRLAIIMLSLQEEGCHNINLVTPEHVVPQILEALTFAVADGLRLPIVYNTAAYDSLESLHLLDGIVDIYMPDFKFWDPKLAHRYLKARDYPDVARKAIAEMHRQVGVLKLDEDGIACRGLLVRHLVMPGFASDSAKILHFLGSEISADTYVNIMDQYRPAWKVAQGRFPEINRAVLASEMNDVLAAARQASLWRFDRRRPWALRL
jgi:putative pyruvate formate lyase activating enzyme